MPHPMEPFYRLGAEVIDVTHLTVDEAAKRALQIINKNKE